MFQVYDVVQDKAGNALYNASVQVLSYPTNIPTPIYSDFAGTHLVPNSTVYTDPTGSYNFFIPDGTISLYIVYQNTIIKIVQGITVGNNSPATFQLTHNGAIVPGSLQTTTTSKLSETPSVWDFGADPTGTADSAPGINAGIAECLALGINELYVPPGTYKVLSAINMANIASFSQGFTLRGAGRFASVITSGTAGINVIDMIGSNDCAVQDLNIDSTSVVSQCAILLARSTVNQNCNNNRIQNVNITGGYSKASVISIAAESTKWIAPCQIQNTHSVSFTGSIASGTLTVSGGTVTLIPGQFIFGTNVAPNTKVLGPAGGNLYSINHAQTVTSEGMNASGNVCLYTSDTNGNIGASSTFGTLFTSSNTDNDYFGIEFYS